MLEVKQVSKSFGSKLALRDFSCTLEPGEIYGLLGANGSGKTTLMKLIANLILPDSGEILLNGTPVSAASRAHIAYMSTEPYFYPYMKIKDVGEYYRDFFADFSQETYREILDAFQLNPNLRTKSLSSGMMAKVKVAVTMSRKADVILLDEPFAGVDPLAVADIQEIIEYLRQRGMGILITDHNVRETLHIVDRVYLLSEGKLLLEGDSKTIAESPIARKFYLGENFSL